MMGRLKSDQGQLFYEFHLGDAVPRRSSGAEDRHRFRSVMGSQRACASLFVHGSPVETLPPPLHTAPPHPSARGSLTLLIHALPSAQYAALRLV
jgi:hypothetical protein